MTEKVGIFYLQALIIKALSYAPVSAYNFR